MNKITIRLPDHLLAALVQEAQRNEMSLSAAVRVTLAKAMNLPLEAGDYRTFDIPPASPGSMPPTPKLVPLHLVWKAKDLIQRGFFIQAIRDIRTEMDIGLYEAKCIVDILRAEGT